MRLIFPPCGPAPEDSVTPSEAMRLLDSDVEVGMGANELARMISSSSTSLLHQGLLMKRLDARVADLEAKRIPPQRVVRVRRHEGQSQEEAIIAAGFDPKDDDFSSSSDHACQQSAHVRFRPKADI